MRFRHHGAALLAAAALSCALPAHADNYTVRDGNGVTQSFGAKLLGGVLYPIHLLYGLFGSTPTPVAVDSSGNVGVNCVSGCSGGGGSLSATAHATAPSDLTEGQTSAGLVVDLSHHLFVRSMQDGAWNVGITGTLPGFASTPTFNVGTMPNVTIAGFAATPAFKAVDSGGGDATDATNHAIKVNVVAGGAGGGAMTVADGADVTLGAKADASCGTDTGTCTLQALIKRLNASITTLNGKIDTLNTTAAGSIPSGSAIIGKTGIDQTTPGTTNGVQDASTGSTGSAVPSKAGYLGAQSNGNLSGVIQAGGSAFLNMTTATTSKIITGTASKKVYITNLRLHAGGATTAKFVEGTGTNCGTGTADLSETWDFTASDGMVAGVGLGPVLVMATAGDDVCVTNSAAQNLRVGVAYETH